MVNKRTRGKKLLKFKYCSAVIEGYMTQCLTNIVMLLQRSERRLLKKSYLPPTKKPV